MAAPEAVDCLPMVSKQSMIMFAEKINFRNNQPFMATTIEGNYMLMNSDSQCDSDVLDHDEKKILKLHNHTTQESVMDVLRSSAPINCVSYSKNGPITPEVFEEYQLGDDGRKYLKSRGLSEKIIEMIKPYLSDTLEAIEYDYLNRLNTEDGVELRTMDDLTIQKQVEAGHKKSYSEFDINYQGTSPIIICEGLISGLSYLQISSIDSCKLIVLNDMCNWGLPDYSSYPDTSPFIIALDNNDAAINHVHCIKERLTGRLLATRLPESKDWNDDLSLTISNVTLDNTSIFESNLNQYDLSSDELKTLYEIFRTMSFKNNVSDLYKNLEESDNGRKVIPWAPGKCKTTTICRFMAKEYSQGIVYAAKTLQECLKVGNLIKLFYLEEKSSTEGGSKGIQEEDIDFLNHHMIIHFHTDNPKWDSLKEYPKYLENYPIIITTHASLIDLPSQLLLAYQAPGEALTKREWLIVDEKHRPFQWRNYTYEQICTIRDASLDPISGTPFDFITFLDNFNNPKDSYIFNKALSLLNYTNQKTEKPMLLSDLKTRSQEAIEFYRAQEQLSLLSRYHQDPLPGVYNPTKVVYNISDLDIKHINLDATGDISYQGSRWHVCHTDPKTVKAFITPLPITVPPRNLNQWIRTLSEEDIKKIQLSCTKNKKEEINACQNENSKAGDDKPDPTTNEFINGLLEDLLVDLTSQLAFVIGAHHKTLIVSYMDFKESVKYDGSDATSTSEVPESLDMLISKRLVEDHLIHKNRFTLTWYQSGQTRGTNEYIDHDAVILLGRFRLPNQYFEDFNSLEDAKLNNDKYFITELVQAIYRIRLREYKNYGYIYYSRDLAGYMFQVIEYLNCYKDNDYKSTFVRNTFSKNGIKTTQRDLIDCLIKNLSTELYSVLEGEVPEIFFNASVLAKPHQRSREVASSLVKLNSHSDKLLFTADGSSVTVSRKL